MAGSIAGSSPARRLHMVGVPYHWSIPVVLLAQARTRIEHAYRSGWRAAGVARSGAGVKSLPTDAGDPGWRHSLMPHSGRPEPVVRRPPDALSPRQGGPHSDVPFAAPSVARCRGSPGLPGGRAGPRCDDGGARPLLRARGGRSRWAAFALAAGGLVADGRADHHRRGVRVRRAGGDRARLGQGNAVRRPASPRPRAWQATCACRNCATCLPWSI